MRDKTDTEPRKTEDDIQREQLGPRGVPGAPDPAKMTPQREKKTPKNIDPATRPEGYSVSDRSFATRWPSGPRLKTP
jgi:hypothetical protein